MIINLRHFFTNESGQGITEYGAILAFVALIITTIFSQQSSLQAAISGAFSACDSALASVASSS